jgi:hypothetical protein
VAQAAASPVILGETSERVGYRTNLTPPGLWTVARRARRLFPLLARAPLVRTWTGWLPSTPDNLPLIGRAPGYDGLVLAADAVAGRANPLLEGVRPERLSAIARAVQPPLPVGRSWGDRDVVGRSTQPRSDRLCGLTHAGAGCSMTGQEKRFPTRPFDSFAPIGLPHAAPHLPDVCRSDLKRGHCTSNERRHLHEQSA